MLGACIGQVLLQAASRELSIYKLDLVGIQEVRWDKGGVVSAGDFNVFYGKERKNQLGTGLFVHHRIASAVTTVEILNDKVSYTVLRGRWCNFIVLNVYEPSEEKNYDSKDSF